MVYLGGGWFNPEMERAINDIKLATQGYKVFSPREDTNPEFGWDAVFAKNMEMLDKCDLVVASTVCKDMGTLFECGYAHSIGKKIVYYSPGLKGDFNLMLAKSAHRVCTTFEELVEAAKDGFQYKEYVGEIE